jgi:hypothetical protein
MNGNDVEQNRGVTTHQAEGKKAGTGMRSLLTWAFLFGAGAVLLLALVLFLYGWSTGAEAVNFTHNSAKSAPFSIDAAANALVGEVFLIVPFGPPLFILAAIIGAFLAIRRRER